MARDSVSGLWCGVARVGAFVWWWIDRWGFGFGAGLDVQSTYVGCWGLVLSIRYWGCWVLGLLGIGRGSTVVDSGRGEERRGGEEGEGRVE